MGAREITHALEGRWLQSYGRSPCPVCGGGVKSGNYSLSIKPSATQGVVLHCFRGCRWQDVKNAINGQAFDAPLHNQPTNMQAQRDKGRTADRVWCEAMPIAGTPAEAYLHGRAIKLSSNALRYHPRLWHGPSRQHQQSMVARLGDGSIHRTFFKAVTNPRKMMLGTCKGRAVRLIEREGPILLAEGLETALSVSSLGLVPHTRLWAALSTSGMKSLCLPHEAGQLTIATDGDQAGAEAGYALAQRANALGWDVTILQAPVGKDWNDVLRGRALCK